MASKTKKPNGRWRVRWVEDGRQRNQTCLTEKEANSLVRIKSALEEERRISRAPDESGAPRVAMFFEQFVNEVYLPLYAEKHPRSLFKVTYQLETAMPLFGRLRLSDRPSSWEKAWDKFKAKRLEEDGVGRETLLAEFSTIRAALNEASQKKMSLELYCGRNPLAAVKFASNVGKIERAAILRFSNEEVDAIVEASGSYNGAIWTLMVNTGLRRGELLQLPRRLCSDNEIEVRHSPAEGLTTKTGKTRFIPLNESARKALRTLLRDEPFKDRLVHKHTEDSLSRAFTVDRIASGVTTKGSLKHLRKTFISNLVNGAGVSLHTAMELAGHTQMKTTQLYLVGTDDQRRKAVDALESLG